MNLPPALAALPAMVGALLISSCASAPKVDPAAQTVLYQTTEKLRSAQTLQASGTRLADPALLPPGSSREFVNFQLAVSRPDDLAVRSTDGHNARHLLAGSGAITLYDESTNLYTTNKSDAKTIDGLVDDIEDQLDVKMTIGEMLGEDPMDSLMEDVREVKMGGDEIVGHTLCTRLDFTQKDLAWHLWIAKSDSLPRMSSITYLDKPGQPKRVVTIHDWKLDAPIPEKMFALHMKPGAEEADVIH